MGERFTSLHGKIAPLLERLGKGIEDTGQLKSKKWLAYGVMLIISLILSLTLGGGRTRSPEVPADVAAVDWAPSVQNPTPEGGKAPAMSVPRPGNPEGRSGGTENAFESWGRDPFAGLRPVRQDSVPPASAGLSLSAISWKDGVAVALINDFIVREGDRVEGSKVVDITPGSVVLDRGGERLVLNLKGGG